VDVREVADALDRQLVAALDDDQDVLGRSELGEDGRSGLGRRAPSMPKESTTCRRPPRARSLSAPRRAAAIIFLGVRCE
jgi:hypothetical protein